MALEYSINITSLSQNLINKNVSNSDIDDYVNQMEQIECQMTYTNNNKYLSSIRYQIPKRLLHNEKFHQNPKLKADKPSNTPNILMSIFNFLLYPITSLITYLYNDKAEKYDKLNKENTAIPQENNLNDDDKVIVELDIKSLLVSDINTQLKAKQFLTSVLRIDDSLGIGLTILRIKCNYIQHKNDQVQNQLLKEKGINKKRPLNKPSDPSSKMPPPIDIENSEDYYYDINILENKLCNTS